ncbi:MAG TPA: O-antigen ligase family protein [Fimbriimonadaceae bacterium]|nr:O-antigen ligase family protein [Fimbriimonadaceae bacterium]
MRRNDIGLFCLLTALFFAIVAGGQVTLDASAFVAPPGGILTTLAAAAAGVIGLVLLVRGQSSRAALLLAASFAGIYLDFLTSGDQFSLIRVLIALAVFGGLAYVLGKNRVVQMPSILYGACVVLLLTTMVTSIFVTEFQWPTIDGMQYWILYAAVFYLTIAVIGRVRGPRLVVETIVFSGSLVALKGVYEYLLMRGHEPTYRIFADWNNPNALAGLFVVVIPLAMALAWSSGRAKRIAGWICGGVCLLALVLTQSKGGLLVAPIGMLTFLLVAWAWAGRKGALSGLAPLALGALLFFAVQFTTPRSPGKSSSGAQTTSTATAPLERVTSRAEAAQSSSYRKLLWHGAIDLFKKQPVGYGAGTYRFYSAESGLNEQTQLAHQSFLQIAVEGGAVALFAVLVLAVAWTIRMFRGARALSRERNVLRAGVTAAVVAIAANGFVESNVFYLATGMLLFVLLGTGLQLAADGTTPESLPASLRTMGATFGCLVPIGLGIWTLQDDFAKAALIGALQQRDAAKVNNAMAAVDRFTGVDEEAAYLAARYGGGDQVSGLKKAAALGPRTRTLRALATAYDKEHEVDKALATLEKALTYDPNNLRTLSLKLSIEDRAGMTKEAIQTANAIIAVEKTPYLEVRALPEYVPTEPAEARTYLASHTANKSERASILHEALAIYVRYDITTVPQVMAFGELGFGGDRPADARAKIDKARAIADELIDLYRELGDPEGVREVGGLKTGLTVD